GRGSGAAGMREQGAGGGPGRRRTQIAHAAIQEYCRRQAVTQPFRWEGVMRSRLTTIILIGMVLGILVGYACHILWPDPKTAKTVADYISLVTDVFLRRIKTIIAPLVFSTVVVGVAHMGDPKAVGRIGAKAMTWFIGASLVSLLTGMILVNILRPGDNLNLPLPDAEASTNLKVASLSVKE